MGSFNNYLDIILLFFDHLSTFAWTLFILNVDKKGQFWTTYPSHLVHLVFERPPTIEAEARRGLEEGIHEHVWNL